MAYAAAVSYARLTWRNAGMRLQDAQALQAHLNELQASNTAHRLDAASLAQLQRRSVVAQRASQHARQLLVHACRRFITYEASRRDVKE
jgi:hypothetical protein